MGNGSSSPAKAEEPASAVLHTLTVKLACPPSFVPCVLGDGPLGKWTPSEAKAMKQESAGLWRLHFLSSSKTPLRFSFALRNTDTAELLTETGDVRTVDEAGVLLARAPPTGGVSANFSLPGGVELCAPVFHCATEMSTLELASAAASSRAKGANYWEQQAGSSGGPPSLHVPSSAQQQQRRRSRSISQAGGRAERLSWSVRGGGDAGGPASPGAAALGGAASFQDLVLLPPGADIEDGDSGSSSSETDGPRRVSSQLAPSGAGHSSAALAPPAPPPAGHHSLALPPQRSDSSQLGCERGDGVATPDAEAAAAAAAASNAALDSATPTSGHHSHGAEAAAARAGDAGDVAAAVDAAVPPPPLLVPHLPTSSSFNGFYPTSHGSSSSLAPSAAPSAEQRPSIASTVSGARAPIQRSPSRAGRHLEMASNTVRGVLDASAVSFVSAAAGTAADRRRLVIVLVGLPARGKSFTAHKLVRYLTWLGHDTRHFNVGKYRREFVGSACEAAFFSADNAAAVASRTQVARVAAEDLLAWLDTGGQVGVYDATNSTKERRAMLCDIFRSRCKILFLELICTDAALIRRNVLEKVLASPDYAGTDQEQATADFYSRMAQYEKVYEPIDEATESFSFIRVRDMASGSGSLTVARINGFLPGRICYYLLNASLAFRPIFLCRHGESRDNLEGRLGGDSSLSPAGKAFASRLKAFVDSLPPETRPRAVWTSTLRRTVQTARALGGGGLPQVQWRALDEIDAGSCDGMTYAQVEEQLPEEHKARCADKLRFRYPRGESYKDVIGRLEPVIIEVERQRSPLLIIAHQAVLRCLLGYFQTRPVETVPYLEVPLHTLIRLTPSSYGMREERFPV